MIRFSFGAAALTAVATVFLSIPPAFAHITLGVKEAPIASGYRAVLRVPHGCGNSATVSVRVRIPEGVIGVKPQPKPGWTLDIVKGDYAKPYRLHGAQVSSGVKEISWTGKLPNDYYDEFVFVSYLSDALKPGAMLYFPVVQECEKGVARWIDIPGKDKKAAGEHNDTPAPGLKLLPKQ
jgi:uncharacterized protein YcnI